MSTHHSVLIGEGPSRGRLHDCTTSPINQFAALPAADVEVALLALPGLGVAHHPRGVAHRDQGARGVHVAVAAGHLDQSEVSTG